MDFILNDESKRNSHGFYLLNEGGDFARFNENPVMLYMHDLHQVIGKWIKHWVDGTQLKATPEFDTEDPDAAKIQGKVDRGYMRGASVGIIIKEAEYRNMDTDKSELYVTKWELFEASVVSVPSNAGALSLKVYDGECNLVANENIASHLDGIVRLSITNKNTIEMDKPQFTAALLAGLSLAATAQPSEVETAMLSVISERDTLKKEIETQKRLAAEALVQTAIDEGRITADKKEAFVTLALSDFETAKATLSAIPEKQRFASKINPATSGTTTTLSWDELDKTGKLIELKAKDPETFKQLYKERFGTEYKS